MDGTLPFGEWLRRRRRSLDLTQGELAQRVGCAEGTIRKFEAEILRPSKFMAARLAEACAIAASERDAFIAFARDPWRTLPEQPTPLPAPTVVDGERVAHLPLPATSLLGREQELAALSELLQQADVRLLTVLGPPGVGKSHLALQSAATISEVLKLQVVFVSLTAIHEPERVLNAIARALEVREVDGRDLIASLQAALTNRPLLLLLDNMEQVVEAGARLVDLIAAVASLKVLVTSRIALRVSGEHLYTLTPLALPDLAHLPPFEQMQDVASIALFVARVKAVRHDFTLTHANAAAVAAICVRLDGLPLALELAAARVRLFPPTMLLARLDRRLDMLTQGQRDRHPRQQTLRAAISWSYQLLTPNQQRLFMRLGVFAGGCTLAAAVAVCNATGDLGDGLVEALETLLDHSLLRQGEQAGELWLTMLETLRDYALEQLAQNEDEARLRLRHLRFYRALLEEGAKRVEGINQPRWLERFRADYENVQSALRWCFATANGDTANGDTALAEEGVRVAGASWWTWWALGLGSEARRWLRLALAEQTPENLFRARALYAAGTLAFFGGDLGAAREQLQRAYHLYQQLGDRCGEAHTLIVLAAATAIAGDPAGGKMMLEQSIRLFRAGGIGEEWGLGLALVNARFLTIMHGQYELNF